MLAIGRDSHFGSFFDFAGFLTPEDVATRQVAMLHGAIPQAPSISGWDFVGPNKTQLEKGFGVAGAAVGSVTTFAIGRFASGDSFPEAAIRAWTSFFGEESTDDVRMWIFVSFREQDPMRGDTVVTSLGASKRACVARMVGRHGVLLVRRVLFPGLHHNTHKPALWKEDREETKVLDNAVLQGDGRQWCLHSSWAPNTSQ